MSEAPPLAGVRVVDLTAYLSGPFATQLLADLGATIIKVEEPKGDQTRGVPPHFVDGDSAYYLTNNRGKESIAVDLKQPEGLAVVLRLIEGADVVVENFRPGVAARLGLDFAELRLRHPHLIWASITGFGQAGPMRDRPAYDMIVQALAGVMSLTGEPDRPAVRLGIPAGDVVAGMFAVIGLLATLSDVRRGGPGRHIDVAMLDSQLSMLSYQAVYTLVSGVAPKPQGARHDSIPTYRSFVAGDGREFVVTANTERMWVDLCAAIDRPDLVDDPRFASSALRLANRAELWPLLEARFAQAPAQHWIEALVARSVPVAMIRNVAEALEDARVSGRGMVVELEDDERGQVEVIASPIRFDDENTTARRFPPRLGQDTDAILGDAGFSADEIGALRASGAVA